MTAAFHDILFPLDIALKNGKIAYDGPSSALTAELLTTLYGAESEEIFAAINPPALPQLHDAARPDALAAERHRPLPFDPARRAQGERRHQAHA